MVEKCEMNKCEKEGNNYILAVNMRFCDEHFMEVAKGIYKHVDEKPKIMIAISKRFLSIYVGKFGGRRKYTMLEDVLHVFMDKDRNIKTENLEMVELKWNNFTIIEK